METNPFNAPAAKPVSRVQPAKRSKRAYWIATAFAFAAGIVISGWFFWAATYDASVGAWMLPLSGSTVFDGPFGDPVAASYDHFLIIEDRSLITANGVLFALLLLLANGLVLLWRFLTNQFRMIARTPQRSTFDRR